MKTCFLVPPSQILGEKVLLNFGDSFNAPDKCTISDGLKSVQGCEMFPSFKKKTTIASDVLS